MSTSTTQFFLGSAGWALAIILLVVLAAVEFGRSMAVDHANLVVANLKACRELAAVREMSAAERAAIYRATFFVAAEDAALINAFLYRTKYDARNTLAP